MSPKSDEEKKRRHREAQVKYRAKLKSQKEQLEEEIERLDKERIRENARVTFSTPISKSNEKTESNIDSSEIITRCEWCGILKGLDHNRLCEFCRQFESKEEMLLEREWSRIASGLRRTGDSDLIPKYRKEFEKTHSLKGRNKHRGHLKGVYEGD